MKTIKIKNPYFNPPAPAKGLFTKGKSQTIPGQDFTPQDILRNFTQGRYAPEQQFTDIPVDSFKRMSIQDKMDYLRNLQQSNTEQKTQIQNKLNALEKQRKLELAKQQEQQLRDSIKKELKSKKNNDDDE